ncbi:MAG: N-acylglucosamine 2-epimerase [Planctomycetota bacterium]|nr:MAG: N-acylglucosamine 2-epimerase [Planctomycetota bacterium]
MPHQPSASQFADALLGDTLPFWMRHAIDSEYGGFFTALDRDGTLIDDDKSVWHQGRFTWLLGELFNNVEPRAEWLDLAEHGARFLESHCFDPVDGRMWFHVTRQGIPIRKRRYAFSESFAAIAFGELARATGKDHYAQQATAAFRRFLDHNLNPPATTAKFTPHRLQRNLGFPMITIATAQELRDSIHLPDADHWIDKSIDDIRRYHMHQQLQCVLENPAPDGSLIDHFDGRLLNPGHAIEAAWFILWEGHLRNLPAYIDLGCTIVDWMWNRGWDRAHGGILYFADAKGLPVQEYWHDMKFWWPHCEGILATLLAWRLTGNAKYLQWYFDVFTWSQDRFADATFGEWFGYLHRDGTLSSTLKGNLWKGPFHLPRMQLRAWQFLTRL